MRLAAPGNPKRLLIQWQIPVYGIYTQLRLRTNPQNCRAFICPRAGFTRTADIEASFRARSHIRTVQSTGIIAVPTLLYRSDILSRHVHYDHRVSGLSQRVAGPDFLPRNRLIQIRFAGGKIRLSVRSDHRIAIIQAITDQLGTVCRILWPPHQHAGVREGGRGGLCGI